MPTPSPTPYDTVELTVSMNLYGDGVCDLVIEHKQATTVTFPEKIQALLDYYYFELKLGTHR
jgi:hypothetical protein